MQQSRGRDNGGHDAHAPRTLLPCRKDTLNDGLRSSAPPTIGQKSYSLLVGIEGGDRRDRRGVCVSRSGLDAPEERREANLSSLGHSWWKRLGRYAKTLSLLYALWRRNL